MRPRSVVLMIAFVAIDALLVTSFLRRDAGKAPLRADVAASIPDDHAQDVLATPPRDRKRRRTNPVRTSVEASNASAATTARLTGANLNAERVSLPVHVVWEDNGAPIAQAEIITRGWSKLRSNAGDASIRRESTWTDEKGVVVLKLKSNADYEVVARVETDENSISKNESVSIDTAAPAPLVIALRRNEHVPFHVVVLDRETLKPVAGARIAEMRGAVAHPAHDVTDAHGAAFLSVLGAEYGSDLEIDADGYALARLHAVGGHATAESAEPVLLRRSASVRGRVSVTTGKPLAGASVFVDSFNFGNVHTPADRDGAFVLARVPARVPLIVKATTCSACPMIGSQPIVLEPGEVRTLDLVLPRQVDVSGTVFGPDGRPVSGGWIEFTLTDNASPGQAPLRADGSYFMPFVVVGPCVVHASNDEKGEGSAACTLSVEVPGNVEEWSLDVHLERPSVNEISGMLLDASGHPVDGGGIQMRSLAGGVMYETLTDNDGSFTMPFNLVRGRFELIGVDQTGLVRSAPREFESGMRNLIVRLLPSRNVHGRVVDATGNAIAYVQVCNEFGCFGSARTGEDGRFELMIESSSSLLLMAADDSRRSACVRVGPDASSAHEIVLTLEASGSMRLVAARSPSGASYRIERDGATLATGVFETDDDIDVVVPAGHVRAIVRTSDGREEAHDVEVRAGATTLVPILGGH